MTGMSRAGIDLFINIKDAIAGKNTLRRPYPVFVSCKFYRKKL
jgi:hypothetical protein